MKNELDENYISDVSIIDMFKISKSILEKYIPSVKFMYCIEGCTYVDIDDLIVLKDLGLNSIMLTWNDKNKYGSGVYTDSSLTNLGKEFINKAIDLKIGIDFSHANSNTLKDILSILKTRKDAIYFASHSNIRQLENRKRNFSDEELDMLREINCSVGIFSNKNFVNTGSTSSNELKISYLKHIKYAVSKLGIDHVMLSTDDMRFCASKDPIYNTTSIFDYSNIYKETYDLLSKEYNKEEIEKIMYKNANVIVKKLSR